MEEYKSAIGDTEEVMFNSKIWLASGGKQKYKFEEDKKKNNPRCQLCEKICYPAEMSTYNSVPFHKNCFRCVFCLNKISPASCSPISNSAFTCSNHREKVLEKGKVPENKKRERKMGEKMTDEEIKKALEEGIQWRSQGKKQSYAFPEDIDGPKRRVDPRCHKCSRTVYPAERFTYEMVPYHRECARCLECNRVLGPSDAFPFGPSQFLCGNHYEKIRSRVRTRSSSDAQRQNEGKKFETTEDMSEGIAWRRSGGKQAYRFPEDTKGTVNVRCNFCGKTSYPAERLTYNGIPYHAECFRCLRCGKRINPGDANPFGERTYLCNNHFQNILMMAGAESPGSPPAAQKGSSPSTPRKKFDPDVIDERMYSGYQWRVDKGKQTYKYPEDAKKGINPRCNSCGKTSYPAETVTYETVPYHKQCFRCLKCNRILTPATATPFGEEVFLCDAHFEQFGQGAGLPSKADKTRPKSEPTPKKEEDELAGLSAVERRRRRRRKQQSKK